MELRGARRRVVSLRFPPGLIGGRGRAYEVFAGVEREREKKEEKTEEEEKVVVVTGDGAGVERG